MVAHVDVKEEPEEPIPTSDSVPVPPSVVLDKLELLVTSGKTLLRYIQPAKGWGINGRLDGQWCAFTAKSDGTCQYVDDTCWSTETGDEWAESELEQFEELRLKALRLPAVETPQPSALQPRACRRAVFAFHKAEHAKQRRSKAKAKASAQPQGAMKTAANEVRKPVLPTPKVKLTPIAKTPPTVISDAENAAWEEVATAEADRVEFESFLADVRLELAINDNTDTYLDFLTKLSTGADAKVVEKMLEGHSDLVAQYHKTILHQDSSADNSMANAGAKRKVSGDKATGEKAADEFAVFIRAVKTRFLRDGQKDKYKQFLVVVNEGSDDSVILAMLARHGDLVAHYSRLKKSAATADEVEILDQDEPPLKRQMTPQPPGHPPPWVSGKGAKGKSSSLSEAPSPGAKASTSPNVPKTNSITSNASVAPSQLGAATPVTAEQEPASPAKLDNRAIDVERDVLAPLRKSGGDAVVQLVKLYFSKKQVLPSFRLAMVKHARAQVTQKGSGREMIILRGPPGIGKSNYAMEQLRMRMGLATEEERAAKLVHIYSMSDYFVKYENDHEEACCFELEQLEFAHAHNEARVQLAMEAGIQPLYIDNSNMQLWEMAAYVKLAQKAGYDISTVAPEDICNEWDNIDALVARNGARHESNAIPRQQLEEIVNAYEVIPEPDYQVQLILAETPKDNRPGFDSVISTRTSAPVMPKPAAKSTSSSMPSMGIKRPATPVESPTNVEISETAKVLAPVAAQRPVSKQPAMAPVAKQSAAAPIVAEPAEAPIADQTDPNTSTGTVASAGVRGTPEARIAASLLSSLRKKKKIE